MMMPPEIKKATARRHSKPAQKAGSAQVSSPDQIEQLKTRHHDLLTRYVQVGQLLPRDVETFDYDDEAAWADVEMVLAELAKIQGQMDALRIQAAPLASKNAHASGAR